jgi:hypothetical protein
MSAARDLIQDMVKSGLFTEEHAAELEEAIGKGREPKSRLAKIAHRTQKSVRKHLKAGEKRAKAEKAAEKEAAKKKASKKKAAAKKKTAGKKEAKPKLPPKAKEEPPKKKGRPRKELPKGRMSKEDARKAVEAYKKKRYRDTKAGKRLEPLAKDRRPKKVIHRKDKRTEKSFHPHEPVRKYQSHPKDTVHSHPNVKKGGGSVRGPRNKHGTWVKVKGQKGGVYKHVAGDAKHSPFRHKGHLGTTPVPHLKHGSDAPKKSRHVMQTKCWQCTREGKLRQLCKRIGPASRCGGAPELHIKIDPTYRKKYNKAYKFFEKYKRHLKGGKTTRSFHKARRH